MEPRLIKGGEFTDNRGVLLFNNTFDASFVKRMYTISNHDLNFVRGWQGHHIEKRWFLSMFGEFTIWVKKINNLQEQDDVQKFVLSSEVLDILYVPSGYYTAIRSMKNNSKLMVMSDYHLHEIKDDVREPFKK